MVKAFYDYVPNRMKRMYAKKEQDLPQFNCSDCNKLQCGNFCSYYNRPVKAKENKCFNHSRYGTVAKTFRISENIEEIIRAEEEERLRKIRLCTID